MDNKIKQKIEDILLNIDPKNYNKISQKLQFKDGKELVVNMIYGRLKDFPSWTVENALTDTEINLKGLENE